MVLVASNTNIPNDGIRFLCGTLTANWRAFRKRDLASGWSAFRTRRTCHLWEQIMKPTFSQNESKDYVSPWIPTIFNYSCSPINHLSLDLNDDVDFFSIIQAYPLLRSFFFLLGPFYFVFADTTRFAAYWKIWNWRVFWL